MVTSPAPSTSSPTSCREAGPGSVAAMARTGDMGGPPVGVERGRATRRGARRRLRETGLGGADGGGAVLQAAPRGHGEGPPLGREAGQAVRAEHVLGQAVTDRHRGEQALVVAQRLDLLDEGLLARLELL